MKQLLLTYNLTNRLCLLSRRIQLLLLARRKCDDMKFLNVAEKNDAAKNIALHLSRGTSRRREGLSQYNKIYEFEAEVRGQKCQMVMTSVSGHLLALEFVGAYKSWQSCSPLSLFDAPVFKYCPDNYEKIKKTLEREVKSCQGLIIWTDCDREGENIGFEIIQVCTAIKSNLQIYRAKFSEITSVSVRRALQNLEQPNKNISDAVDVRQELDLRIGAAFTRFQTLRLQKVFPRKLAESLVSYGSCQFPTLGFVVERYRAVESFVAEQFWKIRVNHTLNNLSVDYSWDRIRLFDREACQVLHDICLENPQAKVCDVKTKPKSKWRPLPLDTVGVKNNTWHVLGSFVDTELAPAQGVGKSLEKRNIEPLTLSRELEKLASRKLKINAKETMRIAEKLYTQGFISYPRTETNEFPKEMNLTQLVSLHTGDPSWGAFAQGILDNGGPMPRQGNKSDKAHPPIHPTKYANNLSGNEQRLYEFIVRSFLACCSQDARGQETTVVIEVANEKFSANGLMITERNYLEVYPYDKWSSKEIHVYQSGQTFNPTSIDMLDGSTSAPNLLTEADLIALMEKHGIGTDATHAEHIETIKNRSYVALADAIHFVPGLLGMGLVEGYDAMGLTISKPHLRAQLEADLKAISEGRKNPQQVLAEQVAKYKEVYLTVTAEANKIDSALAERFSETPNEYNPGTEPLPINMPSALKCPKCGTDMAVRQKKNNPEEYYIGCLNYPNCKNAVWFPNIVKSLTVLTETCPTCGPNYKKMKFEWRNNSISHLYPPPYTACIGGCDTAFLEIMKINLSSVKVVSERPRQTANPIRVNSIPNTVSNIVRDNNTRNVRQNQNIPNNNPRPFLPPPNTNTAQNPSNLQNTRMPIPRSNSLPDDNNVTCGCNQPAILLTVRKQTPNFGKKFYKCPIGKEAGGCDFFLWAPESADVQNNFETPPPSTTSWGTDSGQASSSNTSRGWGIAPSFSRDEFAANEDGVTCNCGLPGKKLTVQKEGPNKGRQFYGCPKDISSRCNFFQWDDGSGGGGGGSSDGGGGFGGGDWGGGGGGYTRGRGRGRGRGAGRGGGGARGGDGPRARRCGLCKQEGHIRSRCPNNQ